jgi:urease accessory protein
MSVASLRSDADIAALETIRVAGGVDLSLVASDGRTRAAHVCEADGWRVRFPRGGTGLEAVLVNTGGGLAGGDQVHLTARLAADAGATITSATAERVYRALSGPTRFDIDVTLEARSKLALLPQETILHRGARLRRRIGVTMAADAALTVADILVLGRRGMPELMTVGEIDDQWRIRRDGRLVHAEAVRLGGDIEDALQRAAIAGGRPVAATLLHIAPDATDRLTAVRATMAPIADVEAAASSWDGKLVVRVLGQRSDRVRGLIAAVARLLTGAALPRVWST